MDSKYLVFKELEPKPKTRVFKVRAKSDKSLLGFIRWHGPWRQYCFFSPYYSVWSKGCLADLIKFISRINCVCGHTKKDHENEGKGSCEVCQDRKLCEEYDGE